MSEAHESEAHEEDAMSTEWAQDRLAGFGFLAATCGMVVVFWAADGHKWANFGLIGALVEAVAAIVCGCFAVFFTFRFRQNFRLRDRILCRGLGGISLSYGVWLFWCLLHFGVLADKPEAASAEAAETAEEPLSPVAVGAPSAKPLPAAYRALCEQLAMDMKNSPDLFRDDKDMTQIIAEGHSGVLALRAIQSSDEDITYVASLGQQAFAEAVERLTRINALPKPPSDTEVMFESFLAGLLTGDPISGALAGGAIGADADQKREAVAVEAQAMLTAMEKADAAHLLLPTIARKYAAEPSSFADRIRADIDEVWGGFAPNDWISLYNNGPDMQDCTVQVELFGLGGEKRINVHFLPAWPAGTWMYARYEPGREILGQAVGKMTVPAIRRAEISVWSPKFTSTATYEYHGAEKDKDIARHCKKLRFSGRYEPYEAGIIFDTQRGCYFSFEGFAYLPKCRADVVYRKGPQSKAWYRELDYWEAGDEQHFTTGANELTFDPDTIDLTLTFPHTSYSHRVTLTIGK